MKVGIVQMPVVADKQANLEYARSQVLALTEDGAQVVILPEMFCCPYDNRAFSEYAEPCGGKIWSFLRDLAHESRVYLVAGSFPESDNGRLFNTCFVFSPSCATHIARHRKMHLFDIDVEGGQRFFESDTLSPGDGVTVFDTPFGKCAVCICFDIRFPELARLCALAGAQVLFIPAAFNMTTGPAHWELTLRARALDNQIFTVACAPARDTSASYVSYANSMICSPWGDVLCCAGDAPGSFVYDLDMQDVERVRTQLPLLSARRTDLYKLEYRK